MIHPHRLAKRRWRTGALAAGLLVALLAACAVPPAPAPQSPERGAAYFALLARGEALIAERAHREALQAFAAAARLDPEAAAPHAGSGSALFRMDRYREALDAFGRALERGPGHHAARHRAWAARLEASGPDDPALRRSIASAIEESLTRYPLDPGAWLAAYRGYDYLHRREDKLRVLAALCKLAPGTNYAARTAFLLREEILQERQVPRRIRLAELFIDRFPREPGVSIAVHALLHTLSENGSAPRALRRRLGELAGRGPGSAEYNRAVAAWMVRENFRLHEAREMLEANLDRAPETQPAPGNAALAHQARRHHARDRYLLARIHYEQGRPRAARTLLLTAARAFQDDGQIFLWLGRLAEERGDPLLAAAWYRRALTAASGLQEAQERLEHLQDRGADPCGPATGSPCPPRFEDTTGEAGLNGVSAQRVAWGDFDNDARPDLLLDGRLFRNVDGRRFEEVTAAMGLNGTAPVNGGLWADYDNDGWLDLFLTSPAANRLYRNVAGNGFEDVSAHALPEPDAAQPTQAAAWGDLDNDGQLDIYVANYERAGVERGLCVHDRLYRNRGDGTFADVSRSAGIMTDEAMCGRGVLWRDLDGDGNQDVLVSNYRLDPNFLWRNSAGGSFSEEAKSAHVRGRNDQGHYGHSIGAVAGDLNNDAQPDVFISNLAHPRHLDFSDLSMLLVKAPTPGLRFVDRYADSGIGFEETSANPSLADVDNDGDLDLYVSSVYPGRTSHLYLNDGTGRFTDVTWRTGTRMTNGWGTAFADYDGDGNLDLLAAGPDGVRLFRNAGTSNHWLGVAVRSRRCNRYGIGAVVRVRYAERQQVRWIGGASGTGVQDQSLAHFGLGAHGGDVDIHVRTLCGQETTRRGIRPGQLIVIDVG